MSQKISVTLTGPTKIEGKWCKPGDKVKVELDLAKELEGAGVIAPLGVRVTMTDHESDATSFNTVVQSAPDAATADLVADLAATRQRLADADIEVGRQHTRIMQLEADLVTAAETAIALMAEIEALTPKNTEGGQSSDTGGEAAPAADAATAPETARKKGAGAADQG